MDYVLPTFWWKDLFLSELVMVIVIGWHFEYISRWQNLRTAALMKFPMEFWHFSDLFDPNTQKPLSEHKKYNLQKSMGVEQPKSMSTSGQDDCKDTRETLRAGKAAHPCSSVLREVASVTDLSSWGSLLAPVYLRQTLRWSLRCLIFWLILVCDISMALWSWRLYADVLM